MSPLKNAHANPLVQLVVMRVREFLREPAAIFWVYVFPLIMKIAGMFFGLLLGMLVRFLVLASDSPYGCHCHEGLHPQSEFMLK